MISAQTIVGVFCALWIMICFFRTIAEQKQVYQMNLWMFLWDPDNHTPVRCVPFMQHFFLRFVGLPVMDLYQGEQHD